MINYLFIEICKFEVAVYCWVIDRIFFFFGIWPYMWGKSNFTKHIMITKLYSRHVHKNMYMRLWVSMKKRLTKIFVYPDVIYASEQWATSNLIIFEAYSNKDNCPLFPFVYNKSPNYLWKWYLLQIGLIGF